MGITVFGAGAIGGVTGGCAALAGEDVTFVDKVGEHVKRLNEEGLRITGVRGEHKVKVKALEPKQLRGNLDLVLLCVKSQDTVASMESLLPHIGPDSTVVSLQNGINEPVIASYIGPERTVGCFVNWSADYHGPGHIEHGGEGTFHIGEMDGSITKRLSRIQGILSHTATTHITDNIFGFLWSKQISAGFYIANALGTSTMSALLDEHRYRPIFLALLREGVAVAKAAGVKLETYPGFDPLPLVDGDSKQTDAIFDEWADHYRHDLKVYSGAWRDVAVRKRPTEVDHLNGLIVEKGKELGVPTPLNERLVSLIKDVESGRRKQDDANFLEFEALL